MYDYNIKDIAHGQSGIGQVLFNSNLKMHFRILWTMYIVYVASSASINDICYARTSKYC